MNSFRQYVVAGLALILTGCATGRMNWDAQVGVLTYHQAISQFGQPASQEKNAAGQTVAEWISHLPAATPGMDNDFRYHSASFDTPEGYETKLRLTFDTNNVLTAWSKD